MTEFDMAYHHNVAVKRKKRLIVLMMLDSPTNLYRVAQKMGPPYLIANILKIP